MFEGIRMVKNGCFVTVHMIEVTEENCDTSYHKWDLIEHLQSSTTDKSQELPSSVIQPDEEISFFSIFQALSTSTQFHKPWDVIVYMTFPFLETNKAFI